MADIIFTRFKATVCNFPSEGHNWAFSPSRRLVLQRGAPRSVWLFRRRPGRCSRGGELAESGVVRCRSAAVEVEGREGGDGLDGGEVEAVGGGVMVVGD